jgi:hypothetical protein
VANGEGETRNEVKDKDEMAGEKKKKKKKSNG